VDGFVLILAIVVFSVFRNVIAEAKKKGSKHGPGSFDTSAEHDEAQDRALDALRQWEARQRALQAGSGDADPPKREAVRIPRPGERRTDVRLPAARPTEQRATQRRARPFDPAESDGAEQTRREAYDAIRGLLAGKTERPASSAPARPAPSRVPAPKQSAEPTRIRERIPSLRARVQGTVRRRDKPDEPAPRPREDRRDRGRAASARLDRFDSLPPLARGIIYAELLGKPVALRGPEEGGGD